MPDTSVPKALQPDAFGQSAPWLGVDWSEETLAHTLS